MIRSISQFHEHERLVAAAQTVAGRCILWAVATLLLVWHEVNALMFLSVTLVMLFPGWRRMLLSLAAIGMIVDVLMEKLDIDPGPALLTREALGALPWMTLTGSTTAVLAMILVAITVALHFEKLPAVIRRFPLIAFHSALWVALLLSYLPGFALLTMAPGMAWRLSYLFTQASRGKTAGTRFRDHLFYMVPVYGTTVTPIGKGLDYLSRHESRDSRSFAASQLAGIKLLLLAVIWTGVQGLMSVLVYGRGPEQLSAWVGGWSMDVPLLHRLVAGNEASPMLVAWASVYLDLIRATLSLAIWGHVIVGGLRLLGFNVFRNTYKPLLAESIVDFWSRYYFYFKELLVEFFFYPTYLRSTWAGLRTRLFLAVFAAAFFGNMYYHVLAHPETVLNFDLVGFWEQWGPRSIYSLLLALGIWISMLRQQASRARPGRTSIPVQLRRIAGVWTFYAVIRIWNVAAPETGMGERFEFFLSLFGI